MTRSPLVAALLLLVACSGESPPPAIPPQAVGEDPSPEALDVGPAGGRPEAGPLAPEAGAPSANTSRPSPEESHQWMVQRLEEIRVRTADNDIYQGDARVRQLQAQLAMHGERPPWRLVRQLGLAEMRVGQEEQAITHLEQSLELMRDGPLARDRVTLRQMHFDLGIASLRLAETENCCAKPNPDSCILPLAGGGLHTATRGAEMARQHFAKSLEYAEKDSPPWLAALWLLNLTHQTLGTWPAGLVAEHRLPMKTFSVDPDTAPRMRNVAQDLGLDAFSLAGGVIADDFTGDGWIDLMVSSWDTSQRLLFYVNLGDGTFEERGEAANLGGLLGGLNMVQADYDNDGDMDFLVLRGAWLGQFGRHPNSLVRNNGDGTFTDVTAHLGLAGNREGDFPTQTAGFADYDLDGDLDLYVGNESSAQYRCGSQLFRNDGVLGFREVATLAGVTNERYAKGVTWGDIDNDGDPDLYVSNNGEPNRLYRNNGDGTFTDIAAEAGVSEPVQSFPCWFWDQDNDGNLDLFVAAYATDVDEIAGHYLGREAHYEAGRLYRGDGKGGFVPQPLGYPALPMGSNFGDLNSDGRLDFVLATGNTYIHTVMPNLLFLQQPDGSFLDATMASGLGHLQKGHGVAFADFDQDGDLDLFHQMGGAYAGDGYFNGLFENPTAGGEGAPAWVALELEGAGANRAAIGARIEVVVRRTSGGLRSIHRVVGSGGSFGAGPLRQVVGLGDADAIERVTVRWPNRDGATQTWEGIPLGQRARLVEGQADLQAVPLPRVELGGR